MYFSFPDDGRTKPVPRKGRTDSFEPADNKCLIRASEGKKKISTVVSELTVFPMYLCLIESISALTVCEKNREISDFSFLATPGQHQRSDQVSNGRLS